MGFEEVSLVKQVTNPYRYFNELTTTTLYQEVTFINQVDQITISNDSNTDELQVSFDGATLDGKIKSGESITLNTKENDSVFIKATTGSGTVRIWGL